jgi:integrase
MANRKVVLVRYCKTDSGWRRYPAVIGKNGRVKPGFVMVAGAEQAYPEGRYQLRTYQGRRMIYEDVGPNAGDALAARDRAIHLLAARESAIAAGVKVEEPAAGRLYLQRALLKFIEAAEDRGSPESALVHRTAGEEFLRIITKTFADEVTEEDILLHQRALRKRGCSDRTIYNRHISVSAFLRYCKLDVKTLAPLLPKYEKKRPEEYSPQELKALFASLKDEHLYLTFEILLKCGLRDKEGVYLEWSKIDFSNSVLKVRSNPKHGFKIKDSEERDVPIEPELLERARRYRRDHPEDVLVSGTRSGKPNRKLLLILKRAARNAGLNCGECKACQERGECESWYLHKFRSTCITKWLRSGMDLRTVMEFSGHSDLGSIMRYLAPATHKSVREKISAIEWM